METRLAKKKRIEEESRGGSEESHGQAVSNTQALVVSNPSTPRSETTDTISHINIFGNQLIFDVIGNHLSISELKAVRLTCELFLGMVSEHRRFSNLRVTVTDATIQKKILSQQTTGGDLELKSVRIVIDQLSASNAEQWVPRPSLRHLEIHHSHHLDTTRYLWSYKFPRKLHQVRGRVHLSTVYKCLQSSELNLVSFTLDLRLWIYEYPADQLSLALTPVVKTLRDLNFVYRFGLWCLSRKEVRNFNDNARTIQCLPWKLRSFSVDARSPSFYPVPNPLPTCIVQILGSSVATLERVKLGNCIGIPFEDRDGLQRIIFPRLKDLNVSIIGQEDRFAEFLSLQPKLESMRLNILGTMDLSLQEAILGNCSPKMHTLVFNAEENSPPITHFNFESWAFLQDLNGLKKFRIKAGRREEDRIAVLDILSHLPPSTFLSLDIGASDHWYQMNPQNRPALPPLRELMPTLTGFKQMSHLKLRDCDYLLDDDALQSICKNMTHLRCLEFLPKLITDFGLTGRKVTVLSRAWASLQKLMSIFGLDEFETDEDRVSLDTGVSLRNLNNLRELVLLSPSNSNDLKITTEGLIAAIQFRELRSLGLPLENMPDAVLVQMASNNPSLETITRIVSAVGAFPQINEFAHPQLFPSILAVNPRVKRIETISKIRGSGYDRFHVFLRPGLPPHNYSGFK